MGIFLDSWTKSPKKVAEAMGLGGAFFMNCAGSMSSGAFDALLKERRRNPSLPLPVQG